MDNRRKDILELFENNDDKAFARELYKKLSEMRHKIEKQQELNSNQKNYIENITSSGGVYEKILEKYNRSRDSVEQNLKKYTSLVQKYDSFIELHGERPKGTRLFKHEVIDDLREKFEENTLDTPQEKERLIRFNSNPNVKVIERVADIQERFDNE
jgi:predicted DNA-binding protein YlxM (UPF0122 family)